MGYLFFPSLKKTDKDSEYNEPFNSKELLNRKVFSNLFDQHPFPIFTLQLDGTISLYNQSLLDTFGYSELTITSEFAKNFFNKHVKIYFNLALKAKAQNFIVDITHKNGSSLTVDLTMVPLLDGNMKVLAVLPKMLQFMLIVKKN